MGIFFTCFLQNLADWEVGQRKGLLRPGKALPVCIRFHFQPAIDCWYSVGLMPVTRRKTLAK